MRRQAVFVVSIIAVMATPALAKKQKFFTEVSGNSYRVIVDDNEVRVFNTVSITAIKTGRTTERRDQMREAVRKTTGCEMVNDIWTDGWRAGQIDCSGHVVRPSTDVNPPPAKP